MNITYHVEVNLKQKHQHYTISKRAIQTYMVNNLVRNPAIVLQDIEISGTTSLGNLLCNGLYKIRSAIYSPASRPRDLGGHPRPQ